MRLFCILICVFVCSVVLVQDFFTENVFHTPNYYEKQLHIFNGTFGKNVSRETVSNKLNLYKEGWGRLGNLLFQYASCIAIASKNNRSVYFSKEMTLLTYLFPNISISILTKLPKTITLKEKHAWVIDPRMIHLPPQNMTLLGFLSSFRYFKDNYQHLLHDWFSNFNDSLVEKARIFLKNASYTSFGGRESTSVCVHVRRGDKASVKMQQFGYRLPVVADILQAMDYLSKRFPNVFYIISSDTRSWCSNNIQRNNTYISNLNSDIEDFVLMSSCDHMIMTVGTFGWWSGWFTERRNGTVMYYYHQFHKGSSEYRGFVREDVFPSTWVSYNSTIS